MNDSDFDQDLCWVLRLEISVVEQITPFCYDYWANNVDLFWKLSILLESAKKSNLIFLEFFDPNNVVKLLVLWKTEKGAERNQSTPRRSYYSSQHFRVICSIFKTNRRYLLSNHNKTALFAQELRFLILKLTASLNQSQNQDFVNLRTFYMLYFSSL